MDQISERSNQAGDQLSGVAGDVRQIASQLRQQDNDSAARLAETLADQVDSVGNYLSRSSAQQLMDDLENLAQSRPWLVAGLATLGGFAAARALSSSSRRRHGGNMVDTGAGSGFDEQDAERDYA